MIKFALLWISQILLLAFLTININAQNTFELEIGQRIPKEITKNQKYEFEIFLNKNQFVIGEIAQRDVNVSISIFTPDGTPNGRFNMIAGQERFYFEAIRSGNYTIKVIPLRFTTHGKTEGIFELSLLQSKPQGDTPHKRADNLLDALYTETGPGGAVAVVRDGKIVYSHSYGLANIPHKVPFTTNTVSNIGSVSKQFTGFAIAILEKEGKLSFDDDIRMYIPECPDLGHVITIKDLLYHTSGFRRIKKTFGMQGIRTAWSREELVNQILKQSELQFLPGSEHSYNNTGYILLAEIIENITSTSYRDWIKENIFIPLDMNNSSVNSPVLANIYRVVSNSADGYHKSEGLLGKFYDEPAFYGASSIYSSVEDLAKWIANFQSYQLGGKDVNLRITERTILTNGDTINYGCGFYIEKTDGIERYSHSGFDGYHWTELIYYPEFNTGIIVLNNFRIFPSIIDKITQAFLEGDFKMKKNTLQKFTDYKTYDINPKLLKKYEYRYQAQEDKRMIVTFSQKGSNLIAKIESSKLLPPNVTLSATSDTSFINADLDIHAIFEVDDKNNISQVKFHYAEDFTLQKLPDFQPTEDELLNYVGLYFSSELNSVYKLDVINKKLTAHHPRGLVTRLNPLYPNSFAGGYLGEYQFITNEEEHVVGFNVQNIDFKKMTISSNPRTED